MEPTVNDGPEDPPRKIIHVDMDAFFASVEQRDDAALRGRPVAVGGSSARGVVAAASYEARAFGVRSAMPSAIARRRCPELVFVKPRFEVYRAVSDQIRAIFLDYTPHVEPLSLDEAYLDVSEDRRGLGSATAVAREIRARIREDTGLTASAGVSYNKFLAKLASDHNKPDGLCVIAPGKGEAFVAELPVARFHGVGPRTAARMAALGIATGADLKAFGLPALRRHFGSAADYFHRAAHGVCHRQVRADRARKSIGAERTFSRNLAGEAELADALDGIVDAVWARVERAQAAGRTVTLKMRFADFRQITRAHSGAPVATRDEIAAAGRALLRPLLPVPADVRLLGLTLSGLSAGEADAVQPALPL